MPEKTDKPGKVNIHVTGMTCATCAATVEKALADTAGVKNASVNFASEKVAVDYDPATADLSKLKSAIEEAGYGTATQKAIFPVSGMTCASCVARV